MSIYTLTRVQINKSNITQAAFDNLKAGYPIYAEMVVTPTTGSAITIRDDDLIQGSFVIKRDSTAGNQIRIGTAIAGELSFKLDNSPVAQAESNTVLGAITSAGNATVIVTAVGMAGSPITRSVAVLENDTASDVAGKIRTNLNAVANITNFFTIGGSGATITLTAKTAAANDSTMNISINNGTCAGLTATLTSITTVTGKRGFDSFVFEGAKIVAKCLWEKDASNAYEFALGTFTIDEVPRKLKSISITALDAMAQFDRYFEDCALSFPAGLDDIIQQCCTDCGVALSTAANITDRAAGYTVTTKPVANNLTYRQVIAWAAQLCGCSAFIDWEEKLRVVWYDTSFNSQYNPADKQYLSTMTSSERYTSDLKENDIQITGVKIIGNDKAKTSYLDGTEDYAIIIDGNLLAQDNLSTLIGNLGDWLIGFTYRPYSCTVKSFPHLWSFDRLTFVDSASTSHKSIISNSEFHLKGNTVLSGKGETAVKKGYATANPLTSTQAAILERLVTNPNSTINSQQLAIINLNQAIAQGMNLYETTVGGVDYRHNLPDIEDSDYICVTNSGGFAWTTLGWNDGDPTWEYGLAADGTAIFNTVVATKFVADLLVAGRLTAPDGVCYFDLDSDFIKVGSGEIGGFTATETMLGTGGGALGFGTKAGIGSNQWGKCSLFAGGYALSDVHGWSWTYAKVSHYDYGTSTVTITACDADGNYLSENRFDGESGDVINRATVTGLGGYNIDNQPVTLYERSGYVNSIRYTHDPVTGTGIGALEVFPKFYVNADGFLHCEDAEIGGNIIGGLSLYGASNKVVLYNSITAGSGSVPGLFWTANATDIDDWVTPGQYVTDSEAFITYDGTNGLVLTSNDSITLDTYDGSDINLKSDGDILLYASGIYCGKITFNGIYNASNQLKLNFDNA